MLVKHATCLPNAYIGTSGGTAYLSSFTGQEKCEILLFISYKMYICFYKYLKTTIHSQTLYHVVVVIMFNVLPGNKRTSKLLNVNIKLQSILFHLLIICVHRSFAIWVLSLSFIVLLTVETNNFPNNFRGLSL